MLCLIGSVLVFIPLKSKHKMITTIIGFNYIIII